MAQTPISLFCRVCRSGSALTCCSASSLTRDRHDQSRGEGEFLRAEVWLKLLGGAGCPGQTSAAYSASAGLLC
jgi:hypothetical protein